MHQIIYSYRRILPEEIPTVTPIDDVTRPMTDAELLNLGLVRIAGDIFSCVHQEERADDGNWHPKEGQTLPGTVLSEGSLKDRHTTLPTDVRTEITEDRTAQLAAVSPIADTTAFGLSATDPNVGDVGTVPVEAPAPDPDPFILHSWAGENRF